MRTLRTILAWPGIAAPLLLFAACVRGPSPRDTAIPFTEASAVSPDGGHFNISWVAPGVSTVIVRGGSDPARPGDRAIGQGPGAGATVAADMPPSERWYFELIPDRGAPLVVADRNLHLASAPNFRDAGGYRTMDGHWVRMGLLYRSDQLDRLSDADLDTLSADGIHLVCDLRTDAERAQGMDRLPAGADSMVADVAGASTTASRLARAFGDPALAQQILGGGKGAELMIEANRQFVGSPSALLAYGDVFERLADPAMLPAVYHCAAGKDRTGWAEAVFLSIMGVPRETIMADYLLSNRYLAETNRRMLAMLGGRVDPSLIAPLLEARPDYLNAAFDEVTKRYGSMESYLHDGLGLGDATLSALRRAFLAGS